MKSQMSSFDIAAVVGEMQPLVGMKVEKVFFPSHDELFFRLTGRKEKATVVIKIGRALWAEEGFRQADSSPPTFAMLLRKHLSGLTLKSVSQHGFDRIVIFEFDSEPGLRLVAEMFGSGNVILVEGDTIIQPLTSKSWRARDVKAAKPFKFPPASVNPFELDAEALTKILSGSDKDLVRCLAVDVNLGGAHAEEVCMVLGEEKEVAASEMGVEQVKRILEIIALFGETLTQPSPYVVTENGELADAQPFWLSIYSESEKKEFGSFGEATKEYFTNLPDDICRSGRALGYRGRAAVRDSYNGHRSFGLSARSAGRSARPGALGCPQQLPDILKPNRESGIGLVLRWFRSGYCCHQTWF